MSASSMISSARLGSCGAGPRTFERSGNIAILPTRREEDENLE